MRSDAHQGEFLGLINFGSGLRIRGEGVFSDELVDILFFGQTPERDQERR